MTDTPAPSSPSPDRPSLSKRRLWLFRAMALALPFAVLLVLELALRLIGSGQDLSLVVAVPGNPKRFTHQFNDSVDPLYYGRSALAGPETRRFDLPKPQNTYRV